MKYTITLFCCGLAASFSTAFAQVKPVFEETFNTLGTLEYLNGAAQGADASGVSGKPGDCAYVAPEAPQEKANPQPGAVLHDLELPEAMSKFTVTCWYKAKGPIADPDTLFNIGGFFLLWQNGSAWTMRLGLPAGDHAFSNWYQTGSKSPGVPWDEDGTWIFYAISWDQDARTATIYQGTKEQGVAVAREYTNREVSGPVGQPKPAGIIGNSTNKDHQPGDRPFKGSIDNIRIYDQVLDAQALDAIRSGDATGK